MEKIFSSLNHFSLNSLFKYISIFLCLLVPIFSIEGVIPWVIGISGIMGCVKISRGQTFRFWGQTPNIADVNLAREDTAAVSITNTKNSIKNKLPYLYTVLITWLCGFVYYEIASRVISYFSKLLM